jgi:hypothetical protein
MSSYEANKSFSYLDRNGRNEPIHLQFQRRNYFPYKLKCKSMLEVLNMSFLMLLKVAVL